MSTELVTLVVNIREVFKKKVTLESTLKDGLALERFKGRFDEEGKSFRATLRMGKKYKVGKFLTL